MGTPSDVDRLDAVLRCLESRGLSPRSVRVGDVAVAFTSPTRPAEPAEAHTYDREETVEQRAERELREYEETMYASSEGARFS